MTPPDDFDFENNGGPESYAEYVAAASYDAYNRNAETDDLLLSAESLPENSSLLDFKAFARDYPEKLAPLLNRLRPEWLEYFVEYHLLEKLQSFIGQTHGCIQTRVWENLRIIEGSIGAMILLGPDPDAGVLRPILVRIGMEDTPHGSLTDMILQYEASRSYAVVAEKFHVPVPMIRKIFRPAIQTLLAAKDIKAVAVGSYLRSLTHQASLTEAGIGKKHIRRLRRVRMHRFNAPPSETSPVMEFGNVEKLKDTPWWMLEISPDHKMAQIHAALHLQCKRIFVKQAAQIFAPTTENGELMFGYIFARCTRPTMIRALQRVRGIAEISELCDDDGNFIRAITVPHEDVRAMMVRCGTPEMPVIRPQDFVEITTGPAARYCGTVTSMNMITEELKITVSFPTGKTFLVTAYPSSVKLLRPLPNHMRRFWGTRLMHEGREEHGQTES